MHAVTSSAGHRRIHRAQRWLENRAAAEEVLIVGATLDAANELAREVAKKKGAAFRLASAHTSPVSIRHRCTNSGRSRFDTPQPDGAAALVGRLVHRMNAEGRLRHYQSVAMTPGFPRAVAGLI